MGWTAGMGWSRVRGFAARIVARSHPLARRVASLPHTAQRHVSGSERSRSQPTVACQSGGDEDLASSSGAIGAPAGSPDRLLLVDANALMYRAYYSFHKLGLSARGRVEGVGGGADDFDTGTLFGFLRMLFVLLEIRPSAKYVVLVFDGDGPTFRHDLYPRYKANREAPKADPRVAEERRYIREVVFPQIAHVCDAMGLHVLRYSGCEADDVIATVCKRARDPRRAPRPPGMAGMGAGAPLSVDIASPDKDFYQLLAPGVRLLRPVRKRGGRAGAIAYEAYTDRTFASDFAGLPPAMFGDVLALAGDQADNVPGVKGIGPKTATKLLAHFQSLDALLIAAQEDAQRAPPGARPGAHGEGEGDGLQGGKGKGRPKFRVSAKVAREALGDAANVERVRMSRALVALQDGVAGLDVEPPWDALRLRRPRDGGEAAQALFARCDFRTLAGRAERLWASLDQQGVAGGGATDSHAQEQKRVTDDDAGRDAREGAEEKAPAIEGST